MLVNRPVWGLDPQDRETPPGAITPEYIIHHSSIIVHQIEGEAIATIFISDALSASLGYQPSEFMESPGLWMSNVHPADGSLYRRALAATEPGACEFRFRRHDGEYQWLREELQGPPGARIGHCVHSAGQSFQEKYEALMEALKDCAIFTMDTEGKVAMWTAGAQSVKGYQAEEVIGKHASVFDPPEDVEKGRLQSALEAAVTRGRHEEEGWRLRKDGSRFWAHSVVVALRDQSGGLVGFSHVSRDLTDRKKAEERFQLVVESAPNGIVIVNHEGAMVMVNAQTERLFGYSRSELIGAGFELLVPSETPGCHPSAASWRDLSGRRKDGSLFPVEIGMNPIETEKGTWVMGAIVDVSERKRGEDRFRLAVESSPNAMVMVNQDGKIVLVNSQTEKLFGYTRMELIGQTVDMLVPAASRDKHAGLRRESAPVKARTMGAGEPIFGQRKDGSIFPAEIGLNPIETAEGTWVLSAIVDITERKRAEESRQKLEAKVQHAQKLESLGLLAGGIAHDFNNLLVSILGHAGLALMELPPQAPARDTVQMIETAAIRAAGLTRQLLAYSGKGRFMIRTIDLSRVVAEMSNLLGVSISKKVEFSTDLSPRLPGIDADEAQVQQVVMNLITNASEAVGDKPGTVIVKTGVEHFDRAYLAETYLDESYAEGKYVYLEVSDTGCGMDSDTRRNIFDPFFTTKFTGRGLGLAAVLGIVRGHRGAIRIFSEPGLGTTFKILFPASEKSIASPSRKPARPESLRGSGTILIVDDEEGVRIVARKTLEKSGFTVLTADDGRAGLEMFTQHAQEITAVLLDMTLPHMSGEEVCRKIHILKPDAIVILSSGYDEQEASSLFVGQHLAGFLQKPYRPGMLIEKMREILERR